MLRALCGEGLVTRFGRGDSRFPRLPAPLLVSSTSRPGSTLEKVEIPSVASASPRSPPPPVDFCSTRPRSTSRWRHTGLQRPNAGIAPSCSNDIGRRASGASRIPFLVFSQGRTIEFAICSFEEYHEKFLQKNEKLVRADLQQFIRVSSPNGNVAVKRIKNGYTIDEKLFYREVNSLLNVNHQNVVRFLGFCANTEQTAIKIEGSKHHIYAEIRERLLCFEYISNGSLQTYISDELRGLEWTTRYQIIKGICKGLHYLHKEKHIIHMDLKPDNILLDSFMVPKITDFGLSRLDDKSQTVCANRYATLGYCAPEYLHAGRMSFKSDMYSLGVIIMELVTGHKGACDNNSVLRRWRHRWNKSDKETSLVYQQIQVIKCIKMGQLCQEHDPCKRPFIWDVIRDINKMESTYGKLRNAYGKKDVLALSCWRYNILE